MATLGQQLVAPELGWKRIDDSVSSFVRVGSWATDTNVGAYGGNVRYASSTSATLSFSFIGTKLRIIGGVNDLQSSQIEIDIDGVKEIFSQNQMPQTYQVLVYEKIGLENKEHNITIRTLTDNHFSVDAIDIDENGAMSTFTVGDALGSPEEGWKRYDAKVGVPGMEFVGSWGSDSGDAGGTHYGGGITYTANNTVGDYVRIKGKITRLRLMAKTNSSGRSDKIDVFVDGNLVTSFSELSSLAYQRIVLDLQGLTDEIHEIKLVNNATNGGVFGIDSIDIDANAELLPVTGAPLTSPQVGWKRYDDSNPSFSYIGNWSKATGTSDYNGGTIFSLTNGNKIAFRFKGTGIRIIGVRNTNKLENITVNIDGTIETFSAKGAILSQVLLYEKEGLTDSEHTVEIVINADGTGNNFQFDAIDIDSTGRLFHVDEVTEIKSLDIGKRIRCNYKTSVSGKVGIFSGLGRESKEFIPSLSTATPDGDFYYIAIYRDYRNRLVLAADRNIQHSISWDTLNTALIGATEGRPMDRLIDLDNGNYYVNEDARLRIIDDLAINIKFALKEYVTTSNANYIIINASYGESSETNTLYSLHYDTTGALFIMHEYGAGVDTTIPTGVTIPLNTPIDLTLTRNSAEKKYELYVNGTLRDTYPYIDGPAKASTGNTQKLVIGGDPTSASSSISNPSAMTLFNVSIENKYVSPTEYPTYEKTKYNEDKLFALKPFQTPALGVNTRLLTGGTSVSDRENEWDKYIAESTLGGKIKAGDNLIWNWNGVYSITNSRSAVTSSAQTTTRGGISAYEFYSGTNVGSSYSGTNTGFRPALVLENLSSILINEELPRLVKVSNDPNSIQINAEITPVNGELVSYLIRNLSSGAIQVKRTLDVPTVDTVSIQEVVDTTSFPNGHTSLSIEAQLSDNVKQTYSLNLFKLSDGIMLFDKLALSRSLINSGGSTSRFIISMKKEGSITALFSLDNGISWELANPNEEVSLQGIPTNIKLGFAMEQSSLIKAFGIGWR
jgi:hypothetical protein